MPRNGLHVIQRRIHGSTCDGTGISRTPAHLDRMGISGKKIQCEISLNRSTRVLLTGRTIDQSLDPIKEMRGRRLRSSIDARTKYIH